jgi:hypothetical protein
VTVVKRPREEDHLVTDQQFNEILDRANAPNKRARFAEDFDDVNDMFSLHQ